MANYIIIIGSLDSGEDGDIFAFLIAKKETAVCSSARSGPTRVRSSQGSAADR